MRLRKRKGRRERAKGYKTLSSQGKALPSQKQN